MERSQNTGSRSMPDSNQHNLPHGGATEGVSQADEGLGLRPAVDSEWSAGGAIPPAANQHAATLLAFVNETNEERIPSYDQVEAAVHGLVEQNQTLLANCKALVEEHEVQRDKIATLEDCHDAAEAEVDGLKEQLEALRTAAQEYRTLISPLYEGEEWEAAEALDAALVSSPASGPEAS